MQLEAKAKDQLKKQKAVEVKSRLDEQVSLAKQKNCRDAALTDQEKLLNKVCNKYMFIVKESNNDSFAILKINRA